MVVFYNAQRAVHVTAAGCLGTRHSLLSVIIMCTGVLHRGVPSSLESRRTPLTATGLPEMGAGRRCGGLNIALSPRFLSSLRSAFSCCLLSY